MIKGEFKSGGNILQIERIGKEPGTSHSYHYKEYSPLPGFGIFAKVIESGLIKNGAEVELIPEYP